MKSTAEKTADNLLNQAREIIIKHDTHSIKKALEKIKCLFYRISYFIIAISFCKVSRNSCDALEKT